tara:strand:+ start:1269 stop:1574 length:306 start_codon:yes stop_codon:yes gene_type:complete
MEELDKNVFIKKWFCYDDKMLNLFITYDIYYIDGGKRRVVFTTSSTDEEIKPQLLHFVNEDLKEKGWVKTESAAEPKYDSAKDPYYDNENLYIPNDINSGS